MHADASELCRQQGPRALQLLARHAADSSAVQHAWLAACAIADNDAQAAIEAWLGFLHAFQCAHPRLCLALQGVCLPDHHDLSAPLELTQS